MKTKSKLADLRRRVIRRMKRDGINMNHWTKGEAKSAGCGSVCCLAGNIYLEARGEVRKRPGEYIDQYAARVWAQKYGKEEAGQLHFYPWSYGVWTIEPEHVEKHLQSIRTK